MSTYQICDEDKALIETWLITRIQNEGTVKVYKSVAFEFLNFVQKPLKQVAMVDVGRWLVDLKNQSFKPATIARKLGTVQGLAAFATDTGYIPLHFARVPGLDSLSSARL